MNKKNLCSLNPLGVFMCGAETEKEESKCKYFSRETMLSGHCDHFSEWKCISCQANAEAARSAARASLEACRESTDKVLDCLNRLAFIVLQEGRKDPDSGDNED
jgi:hypothetical protein